jgi:hypothetical protein
MLREETRPVAPVGRDGHASDTTDEAHPREIAIQHPRDGGTGQVDELGIPLVLVDTKPVGPGLLGDVTIAEVDAEEVGIRGFVEGVAIADVATGGSARGSSSRRASVSPLPDRGAVDPRGSRDLTVVPTIGNQREHSIYFVS